MADGWQVRVPTWCPFRLQFYFNGHNRLATALHKAGIDYELVDNAIVAIDDFAITWVPTSYQPSGFRYQPEKAVGNL